MSLFSQLEEISKLPHVWTTLEKSTTLASIILATRPAWVIEVGVWSGSSLVPMALACKEVGHGKVIGIDPYSAQASIEGQSGANAEWWNSQENHEMILKLAMERIETYGVRNTCELVRQKSDEYELPPETYGCLGLLHVDGNHGLQALADVRHFAPRVVIGGFVVLDDLHWEGDNGGVSRAHGWLEDNGFIELFRVQKQTETTSDDWCVMQRVK